MNASAIAHFVSGGIMVLWGLKDLGGSRYISKYRPPQNEFLYNHGFTIGAVTIGLLLLGAGLLTLREKAPKPPPGGSVFIWDMPPIFGFIAGIPMTVFASLCVVAIIPYVADRGFVVGQILVALFLFVMLGALAFALLHYRRTTILDPVSQRVEIAFGKPFVFHRKSFAFSDFQSVATEITYGKRGARFFRTMAAGEGKKPTLIATTMSEAEGRRNLETIAVVTGWTQLDATLT